MSNNAKNDKASQKNDKKKKKRTDIETIEFVNKTPIGEKKDMSEEMMSSYHAPAVESAWYEWWEKCGFFRADENDNEKEKFVIMLPPPNVTGSLHLGHSLTVAIQDTLCRWHRMKGKNVLYLPGIDHAGIATQVVVEKKLFNETKQTRHDLGREKFIEKVWEWKEAYGKRIVNQLKRTGASLDWSREVFTMDDKLSKGVTEAFVRMNEKGIIYRDTRLVNWCSALNTAISNIEVEHKDFDEPKNIEVPGHEKKVPFGYIWSFAYKFDGEEDEIVVSTTRPETMLGDVAVAVHPDDERYKKYHGKLLKHPFVDRKLKLICDAELVDPEFGTGAVKITPAHDPNDFLCGKRHDLEFINVLNDDGTMNENCAEFKGMKRFEARYDVIKALEAKGLSRGREKHKLSVGTCSRSKDIIEPRIKPQWFVDCTKLAERSVDAVKNGELKVLPEHEEKTWFRWLENIQDWCISRQLWWGHRIPAYFVKINGKPTGNKDDKTNWVVARTEEEAKKKAADRFNVKVEEIELEQDEDVLDTWFSSGLFPFSTLGWPDTNAIDFKQFYPNNMLETGLDIIFFWVARMVMMGLCLTDKLPFDTILLHSMVRDKFGRKMSKSLGNVVDPLDCFDGIELEALHAKLKNGNLPEKEVIKAIKGQNEQFPDGIPQCGSDAVRFTLLDYTKQGRDINLDIMRVFSNRTFCNKLWNLTKFALTHLQDYEPPVELVENKDLKKQEEILSYEKLNPSLIDKWILSRLNNAIKESEKGLENCHFSVYTEAVHRFFLNELCDIYLELVKPVMADKENMEQKRTSQTVLYVCLEQGFRLLHPTMPFITEELWQRLPSRNKVPEANKSIMINPFPKVHNQWSNEEIERKMDFIMEAIKAIRSVKSSYNLTYKQNPTIFIKCDDKASYEDLQDATNHIQTLAATGEIKFSLSYEEGAQIEIPKGCAVSVLNNNCVLHILLKGLVDFSVEVKKLEKKIKNKEKAVTSSEKKIKNPKYVQNVPQNIRDADAERLELYKGELESMRKAIEDLKLLID